MLDLYKYHTDPDSLMQSRRVFKYDNIMVQKIMLRYISELQAGKYPNVMDAFGADKFEYIVTANGDICGIYPLGTDKKGCAVRICLWEGRDMDDLALDCILVHNGNRYIAYSEPLTDDPEEQTYELFKKTLSHLADKQLADGRD